VKREFSAGGVVVRRMSGRDWVAAVRPRREHDQRRVWALPKGLIDEGETPAETAVREVFEETGLVARIERKLGDVRYVYTESWPDGSGERVFKIVSFFLLRPVRGRLGDLPSGMELEIEATSWMPLDDAPRLLSYGGERDMAQRALETRTGLRL
jgi:8-oxo-dGTP pyrophosphatase MutT (NUDIX family)